MIRLCKMNVMVLVGLGLLTGCQNQASSPIPQSSEDIINHPKSASAQPPADSREAHPPPENRPTVDKHKINDAQPGPRSHGATIQQHHPRRPANTWVIFREAFKEKENATFTAQWIRRNRFQVKTDNIRRLTVDMTRLPAGAPRQGPWIIIIDGQGVEMTGFIPKPGYTGLKRDLVRSQNGQWTVDRHKLYRAGR